MKYDDRKIADGGGGAREGTTYAQSQIQNYQNIGP